jgi:guanine deaminase
LQDIRHKTVLGTFCHAPRSGAVDIIEDALVAIDETGRIAAVTRFDDPRYASALAAAESRGALVSMKRGTYVLPGFIDLHVHAPQYPQLGKALHVPLEVWLQDYTFPLEAKYADLVFARRSYDAIVCDLLASGTTTAVYFATVHEDATRLLVDICLERGQRALVGKVAMDNPAACPDFYRDASTDSGLESTRALIAYVRDHPSNRGLVSPVVTPRFIPSCTDAMLAGLGSIAGEFGCHVQTHCSESDWEHGYVLARYGRSDTDMLDTFGLLTRRTVLAHGNLISSADMICIRDRGAGIAHCPLSNVYFSSAVFPLRAALAQGVRVGLGTDIAGGPSASLLDACRMAVAASRMLEDGVDSALSPATRGRKESRIDFRIAFHLATAGGADVLDLPIGRFEPGCHFDAMVIDPEAPGGTIRLWGDLDDEEDALQKVIYGASRANITQVWVGGRAVAPLQAHGMAGSA